MSARLGEAKGRKLERETINEIMKNIPNPLENVRLDAFTFYYGFQYMKKGKPRVMYFAFDETDDFTWRRIRCISQCSS